MATCLSVCLSVRPSVRLSHAGIGQNCRPYDDAVVADRHPRDSAFFSDQQSVPSSSVDCSDVGDRVTVAMQCE